MNPTAPRRRLVRRLFTGQLLVVLAGAATLGAVAFVVAPPIFRDHVRRAMGPVSDVVAHHLDSALSETLVLTLSIGIVASAAAAAAVSWLLATRIARPIEELSHVANELAAGRLETRAPPPVIDDELAQLTTAFNGMADALERTEATRRRLLADLAHELRTPLATIEAYHEGLADGVVEATPDTAAVLADATGRLRRLVDDVALVSRAEEGQLQLASEPVDVRRLVRRAVEVAQRDADDEGVELRAELPEHDLTVLGDPDRLAQVLANLMANAVEHTPQGGRVTVGVALRDGQVEIAVADTGAGIAHEHLPHVFERFYRADPSRRRVAGSGIGLTISRAIVLAHGGELTAESPGPGLGATLTARLPAPSGAPLR